MCVCVFNILNVSCNLLSGSEQTCAALLQDLLLLYSALYSDIYLWFVGKLSNPFTAPYCATKSALNGFFGSLSHELAMKKSNVSISLITLGLIDTESALKAVRFVNRVQ